MKNLFALGFFLLAHTLAAANSAETFLAGISNSSDIALFSTPLVAAQDFSLIAEGEKPKGFHAELLRDTVEWVRQDSIAIPRARLRVTVENLNSGMVELGDTRSPFTVESKRGTVEFSPPLITGEKSPILFHLNYGDGVKTYRFFLKFTSNEKKERLFVDANCSAYGVELKTVEGEQDDWIYAGCRFVRVPSDSGLAGNLVLTLHWANAGEEIETLGQKVPSKLPSVWTFDLNADPGELILKAGRRKLSVRYTIPKKIHKGNLGMGIGPYNYNFKGDGENIKNVLPVPTLYASYFLADKMRLIAFDITTIGKNFQTDLGLYLNFTYVKALDNRISLNFMLGVHALAFTANHKFKWKPDLPQGAEVVFTDLLMRSTNLSFGGFLFPQEDNYYYNLYVRWGTTRYFIEWNYIAWQREIDGRGYQSVNNGICVGFPLFGFL